MYSSKSELHPFAVGIVDSIEARTLDEVQSLRAAAGGGSVPFLEILGLFEKNWSEGWSSPAGRQLEDGGFLSKDDAAVIDRCKAEILNEMAAYSAPEPPPVLDAEEVERPTWVTKAVKANRYYWPLLREQLERRLPAPVVDAIDRDSERVLERLHDPQDVADWQCRGLVSGQVQSGKTTNYSSLICKAADAGYRMIVVFSGILNDLRTQTQIRLDEDFTGVHQYCDSIEHPSEERCGVGLSLKYDLARAPNTGTWVDQDFLFRPPAKAERLPWLFVVKKNTTVFRNLTAWLANKVSDKQNWPLLVIDDEADQASVNTSRSESVCTTTNRCIRELLALFPRSAFVGYTATPFANLFISSTAETKKLGKDLFPRDFILRLNPAPNYFGSRDFFGDQEDNGLELLIPFERSHADAWLVKKGRHFVVTDDFPSEAEICIRQFLFATALRIWRQRRIWNRPGWNETEEPVLESSMLVHVSWLVRQQRKVAQQFSDAIEAMRAAWTFLDEEDRAREEKDVEAMLGAQRAVTERLARLRRMRDLSMNWELPDAAAEIFPLMHQVLSDLSVIVLNGEDGQATALSAEGGLGDHVHARASIIIGGNKLSRGLTIPGLCVSMSLRTSTMYDTLLQMGRWFGYRDGYVDLCRICTTPSIISNFQAITEACQDFERQVDEMNTRQRTPENYRLAILKHPGLLITARNKMRSADEAVISFSGRIAEQRVFDLDDGLLQRNAVAAERLIARAAAAGRLVYASDGFEQPENAEEPNLLGAEESRPSGRLWRGVPADDVLAFLKEYSGQTGGPSVEQQGVADYIGRMAAKGELVRWNVFVPGRCGGTRFGSELLRRRIMRSESEAVLKTLKSGGHEFVGVPEDVVEKSGVRGLEAAQRGQAFRLVREAAGALHPDEGYFILYLLKSGEKPEENSVASIVSYYLWLPASGNPCTASIAQFNATVRSLEEDEEAQEEEEDAE